MISLSHSIRPSFNRDQSHMSRKWVWSINAKLLTGFLSFCILLAGIGYYTTRVAMSTLADSIEEHSLYLIEKIRSDFSSEIEIKRRMLFLYLEGSKIWKTEDPVSRLNAELLDGVENKYGLRIFDRAILTDHEGNCIADTKHEIYGNLSQEIWWQKTKQLGYYEDLNQKDSTSVNVYFPLSVSVYDEHKRFAGILLVHIDLSVFTQQMATSNLPHKTSQIRILNSSGELLFSTKPYSPYTDITQKSLWNRVREHEAGYFLDEESGFTKSYAYSRFENDHRAEPWYFLVDSHLDEVFKAAQDLRTTNYIILGLLILLGLVIAFFISRSITKPLFHLKDVVQSVGSENLHIRTGIDRNDEVGRIAQSFDSMMDLLQQQTDSLQQQNWIETGQNLIGKIMREGSSRENVCSEVLTGLAQYVGADIGVCYLLHADSLKRESCYACISGTGTPDTFKYGEGYVGQAAAEKKILVIDSFPSDYVHIGSTIGTGSPTHLIEVPILLNYDLKGIIELGFIDEMPPFWKNLLTAVTRDLAITLDGLQRSEIERRLLETTEEQKQELLSQQEELRVTNEELEEQTERLRLSEDNLKQQQAELEEANAELKEKNIILKEKQETIETSRKELQEKAEELKRESTYKSEFLSNMSHELRTPLNSLLLLSQDLLSNEQKNLTEEQIESAQIIYNGGKDLLALINQILDMSKIEAGKMELHPDTFFVKNFRDILIHSFSLEAKKKGIDFDIDSAPDTPKKIVTDVMRVEQILRNLIGNSLKFTENGGVSVYFFRGEYQHQEMLGIRITDTGIGIPEKLQKEIFSAFHQGDNGTSRRFGGTGLGLTITKELVGLLHGTIALESTQGEGTTFTVLLPVIMEGGASRTMPTGLMVSEPYTSLPVNEEEPVLLQQTGDRELLTYKPPLDDDRNALRKETKTILIIEDDMRFLSTVMKRCKYRGYNCIAESSGQGGLKSARTYKPDGIILDLHLPGMNGYDVLEQLKNDVEVRHIPVHIMSIEEPSLKVYKQGAMGFLTKPVDKKSLDDALNKLMRYSEVVSKRILIVEDDVPTRERIEQLLKDTQIEVDSVGTGRDALDHIKKNQYDCIVLDLGLPDMDGYTVIENLQKVKGKKEVPPVIIYTGCDVSEEDLLKLEEFPQSVILKDVHSEERLLDEVTLFLHQVVDTLDSRKRQVIADLHNPDAAIAGHRILVVDDDMRTLFAVAKTLNRHGLQVVKAESGKKAISLIKSEMSFDLILMDIMMPEMNGFETMRTLRQLPEGKTIPIIALTAKAMKGDREKCIRAGANDYLAKPVDVDKLLSLMRVWLYT